MGTDYYLADPVAKEVTYIDRCGRDFACDWDWEQERKEIEGWPFKTPMRVLDPSRFRGLLDEPHFHRQLPSAIAWCIGRETVLLIDDTSPQDDKSSTFCFEVVFGDGVDGWKGQDMFGPKFAGWSKFDVLAKL